MTIVIAYNIPVTPMTVRMTHRDDSKTHAWLTQNDANDAKNTKKTTTKIWYFSVISVIKCHLL
jgi:hypothetical protein